MFTQFFDKNGKILKTNLLNFMQSCKNKQNSKTSPKNSTPKNCKIQKNGIPIPRSLTPTNISSQKNSKPGSSSPYFRGKFEKKKNFFLNKS